jgi:hypothetical protein
MNEMSALKAVLDELQDFYPFLIFVNEMSVLKAVLGELQDDRQTTVHPETEIVKTSEIANNSAKTEQ